MPSVRVRPPGRSIGVCCRGTRVALLALVLVAGTAGCAGGSGDDTAADEHGAATSASDDGEGTTVVSSAPATDPADLAELVAASQLVVTGRVTAVDRGEPLLDDAGSDTGVDSVRVTVAVDSVLSGADPGAHVVVEEEGWLDEARISVDGAPPAEVGDSGIWFLVHAGAPDDAPWLTAGRVGRWLEREGLLTGPRLDIGIAIDLQDRPLDDVVTDIEGLTGRDEG